MGEWVVSVSDTILVHEYPISGITGHHPGSGFRQRRAITPLAVLLSSGAALVRGRGAPERRRAAGGVQTSLLTLRRWRARAQGIRDLPGVGSLEGRRLGFVDGILGEARRISGVGLGPLSPPLGGLCVMVVPLLVELGAYLLELLLRVGLKAGPGRGQIAPSPWRDAPSSPRLAAGRWPWPRRHEPRSARGSHYERRPRGPRPPSPFATARSTTRQLGQRFRNRGHDLLRM